MKRCILIFFILFLYIFLEIGNANEQVSWTDLPNGDLSQILYEYNNSLDSLDKTIKEYHKIEKTKWIFFNKRIKILELISERAKQISYNQKEKYLRNVTLGLGKIAQNKANYLKRLKNLKNGEYENLKKMVYNKFLISKNYFPLFLNNLRKYNYRTEEVWGEYFVEAVDPCHRRLLNSYYNLWKLQEKTKKLPDFFLWLEDKDVSVFFPSIKIFNTNELKNYKVVIKNGKFYSNGELISTYDVTSNEKPFKGAVFNIEPIFIINSKEDIYLCYSSSRVGHTSLSNYEPLIGSGKLKIKDGIVREISFDSGHYLPKEIHSMQVLRFFEKQGIVFSPQTKLNYFHGHDYIETTVKEFKKIYAK